MSAELGALLRALLLDSSKLEALTPEQERALVASLRPLVREQPSPVLPCPPPSCTALAWSEDDLLTIDEAAAKLRVSPRWLYRHAKTLPFSRKLSRKVLRFSRTGIARWLATRRT
jgi:predicted DNA-binding transcriptional regulator AlpA